MLDDLKKMLSRQHHAKAALTQIPTDRLVRVDVPWSRFCARTVHASIALEVGGCRGASGFPLYTVSRPAIGTYIDDISNIAAEHNAALDDLQVVYDESEQDVITLSLLFVFETFGQAMAVAWRLDGEAHEDDDLEPDPTNNDPKWIVYFPTRVQS